MSRVVRLYLHFRSSERRGRCTPAYKHLTPNGVKVARHVGQNRERRDRFCNQLLPVFGFDPRPFLLASFFLLGIICVICGEKSVSTIQEKL